jgi:hypothetical protein
MSCPYRCTYGLLETNRSRRAMVSLARSSAVMDIVEISIIREVYGAKTVEYSGGYVGDTRKVKTHHPCKDRKDGAPAYT